MAVRPAPAGFEYGRVHTADVFALKRENNRLGRAGAGRRANTIIRKMEDAGRPVTYTGRVAAQKLYRKKAVGSVERETLFAFTGRDPLRLYGKSARENLQPLVRAPSSQSASGRGPALSFEETVGPLTPTARVVVPGAADHGSGRRLIRPWPASAGRVEFRHATELHTVRRPNALPRFGTVPERPWGHLCARAGSACRLFIAGRLVTRVCSARVDWAYSCHDRPPQDRCRNPPGA